MPDEAYFFPQVGRVVLWQMRMLDRRYWATSGSYESVRHAITRGVVNDYGEIIQVHG